LIAMIQFFVISKIKFSFTFDNHFVRIFLYQFALALAAFLGVEVLPQPYPYLLGVLLISLSIGYSWRELDKRIGIKNLLSKNK